MWDWIAFLIGFLIGLAIMLLISWALYVSRSFVYSNCPDTQTMCRGDDYYRDPGEAIANGADINQILFINDEEVMYYKRVPKNNSCMPGQNQIVKIQQPQYCQFTLDNGQVLPGKNLFFGSDQYIVQNGSETIEVKTTNSCRPDSSIPPDIVIRGIPILEWNASY